MEKKKRTVILIALSPAILLLSLLLFLGNKALEVNTYTIYSDRIPVAFDGYRIAHISDLHNAALGKNNGKLLAMLKETKPDIIAITGDFIDSRNTNVDVAVQFAAEAVKIAPCYYVSGNHEARVSEYAWLKETLTALGIHVLEDAQTELIREDAVVSIIGVRDPSFATEYLFGDSEAVIQSKLQQFTNEDTYTILLSHRPELFETYVENNMDLVLSGHAHGGQIRLPFLGGLVAPNQGLFPVYDAGLFTQGNTHMIVSRGIGNSMIPLRVNNPPEIVLIELKSQA